MNLEQRYLNKINNDINENLFDLLLTHIQESHQKIKENKKDFIKLLEDAIEILKTKVNHYNKPQYYRYILLLCNKILKYDTKRNDLKDLKKEIIEDFKHSEEHNEDDIIPLNYQINEIRITYDVSYLNYLIKNTFMRLKMWDNALYGLLAARLVEPDNLDLDEYYTEIKKNIQSKGIKEKNFGEPKDKLLILDSNVVISHIANNVEGFIFGSETNFNLEKLGNNNKFGITPSVFKEVEKHIEFILESRKNQIKKYKNFNYNNIKEKLYDRLEKFKRKYTVEVNCDEGLIEEVKLFYMDYMDELEQILVSKLNHKSISHKLRKLAQREGLLPEEGDMRLLAETISLSKDQDVGLLSEDKDFTHFVGPIKERFDVEVY
jgi:hypothetical protein